MAIVAYILYILYILYIYIYIRLSYIYIGGWGGEFEPTIPGNRFRFRFVFVSCVRASGRGEAAWAREGSASPSLGLGVENYAATFRDTFGLNFVRRRVGFKPFCPKSWVSVLGFCAQACGF